MKKIATYKGVVMASDCNAENHMSMTKYVDKFDQAGQRFFLEMGLSPYKTKALRIVAIEQQTKYLKEAYEEDLIDIYSSLVTIGNKAFTVFHEMFNANSQELISTMTIVFTFFDKNTKRAMPFPKEIKAILMRGV